LETGVDMLILHYPSSATEKKIDRIVNRGLSFRAKDEKSVARILADIRKNGDRALISYVRRFDAPGLKKEELQVTRAEISTACRKVSRAFMQSLNLAARQIEDFHRQQTSKSWITTDPSGRLLGQLVHPVDAAGIYVPGGQGGKTPLVSSVLMGVIPAIIAGVKKICLVTPPTREGDINPHILAAAKRVGVESVFKAGSAWGIAALAYGTETIPRVDVIAGPGNIYVTLAKKLVAGRVGIDMVAGPSEILVIADDTAHPGYIAADLLSQAEHDPVASAILITTSESIAGKVNDALSAQIKQLSRKDICKASLEKYGALIVVKDIEAAFELANRIAPEHLELQLDDPLKYIGRVRNAGALFLGKYTPESVGDYVAGPNHILPTAGAARFASALSVDHFIKKTSLIHYPEDLFRKEAKHIERLAKIEGLEAHANSVRIRVRKKRA
jgi:histidinol dehydrogenase